MPINFSNNVPFKLTPQDMGSFDLMAALTSGQKFGQSQQLFPEKLREAQLMNALKQVQAKYAEPNAQQALLKEQQFNKMYIPDIQSQIGLRGAQAKQAGAQAGHLGKQTEWYDREAKARIAEQEALAGQHGEQAKQAALFNRMLQKRMVGGENQPSYQENPSQQKQPYKQEQYREQQPVESTYGIPNPIMTNDDIINQKIFGIDTYKEKAERAKKQQDDQYVKFNEQIAGNVRSASSAQKAKTALTVFNDAMDKASLTGPYWGTSPTSGWRTALHPFTDYSNDQIAENAQANLIPGAMAEVKEAMGEGKFSVIDMQAAQRMKVDRTMTPIARRNATDFMNGIFNRMDESSKFYQTLNNPKIGVDKSTADLLWQNYQNEFPLTNEKGAYQTENMGNWPLFTTPRAIASVKTTGMYRPTTAEKNSFMMSVPDKNGNYHMMPVKKGKVEKLFKLGAKPL